jgi:YegS/Rv2252/BmrU family lipid kinase
LRTRFYIIHNPNAGRETRRLYDGTLAQLQRRGATFQIMETARHGEGMEAAAAAARSDCFDAILAAGGDGTVRDVAEGVLGQTTPVGIIPIGTGNVFAREINLPRSPETLARSLVEGEACAIPVGEVNGRPFLFVIGIGFDAEAVRMFEKGGTRSYGRSGFAWPVLQALASHQDGVLDVQTDHSAAKAQWIIVTRAKRYAANLMLTPDADLHGSQLFVLRMKGNGVLTRLRQLAALAVGRLRFDPGAHLESASWVRIDGDRRTPVQIDGEILGELPLEIRIHPIRLRIILPFE